MKNYPKNGFTFKGALHHSKYQMTLIVVVQKEVYKGHVAWRTILHPVEWKVDFFLIMLKGGI